MSEAGGSAATWQVPLLVRSEQAGAQARMAEAMGISGATLSHHLNAPEARGFVRRWREASNRREQRTAHAGRRGAVRPAALSCPTSRRAPALAAYRRGDPRARRVTG